MLVFHNRRESAIEYQTLPEDESSNLLDTEVLHNTIFSIVITWCHESERLEYGLNRSPHEEKNPPHDIEK